MVSWGGAEKRLLDNKVFWCFPEYTQLLTDHNYEVTADVIVNMFVMALPLSVLR